MKFLFNIIPVSSCPSPNWACLCGGQDIPEPFHLLSCPYSLRHSPWSKNDGPNTSCPKKETLAVVVARNGLSTFLPQHLYSKEEDARYADGYYSCLQRLSRDTHSQNYKSVSENHDSDADGLHFKLCSDILSPIQCDNLNYLLNESSFGIPPFNKAKMFIETKSNCNEIAWF